MGYGLGNPTGLAFDFASVGLTPGRSYYLDQYDPGWTPGGPHVIYNPDANLGGNPGLSPWGYLIVTVPFTIRPRGPVLSAGRSQRAGWYRYYVILRDRNDLDEVVRALQPGAQAAGNLPHLSILSEFGLIPAGTSSNPTYDARPYPLECDPVAHGAAVSSWQLGRMTDAELVAVAQRCLNVGGTLDPTLWNERNIPGWLAPAGGAPRIGRTGDGTVTLPDGTPVDAPTGGTTELPPSEPRPGVCPEGYYLANGRCYAPWDPNGPEYNGSEPPGPDDDPPPPSGTPPVDPDQPPAGHLFLWGGAGLALALILGRRRRT